MADLFRYWLLFSTGKWVLLLPSSLLSACLSLATFPFSLRCALMRVEGILGLGCLIRSCNATSMLEMLTATGLEEEGDCEAETVTGGRVKAP